MLTKEQVEEWRSVLLRRYSDVMDYKLREELNALCDMALRTASARSEGVEKALRNLLSQYEGVHDCQDKHGDSHQSQEAADAEAEARAALAAPHPPTTGTVTVPLEPTEAMQIAGHKASNNTYATGFIVGIYKAMLSAHQRMEKG